MKTKKAPSLISNFLNENENENENENIFRL